MNRWIGFAIGAAVAGAVAYQVYFKGILTMNGRTLGIAEEEPGAFGFDDILKGGVVLGGSVLAIKLVHDVLKVPVALSPV